VSVAARRYAKALIDVLYPRKAESGLEQLQKFTAFLSEQPEVRQLLENPTVSADRRKRLLGEIGDALFFDGVIRNLLNLLVERNRLDLIDRIVASYRLFLDEKLGVVQARVTSAYPLDPGQERRVAARLRALTGRDVRMELSTDPQLIGGFIAEVDGAIYDSSVRQQLRLFHRNLTSS